jgi:hypothetical protein
VDSGFSWGSRETHVVRKSEKFIDENDKKEIFSSMKGERPRNLNMG